MAILRRIWDKTSRKLNCKATLRKELRGHRRKVLCETLEGRLLLAADMGWGKPFGDSGFDYAAEVATDENNNVYAVSRFEGSIDLDPDATYADNRDLASVPLTGYGLAITKFDSAGNLLWSQVAKGQDGSEPGAQNAIPADVQVAAGGVYVTGNFYDLWDFDPDDATTNSTVHQIGSGLGSFLLRLDATSGDFEWVKGFGLTETGKLDDDSLAVDPLGNVYLSQIMREGGTIGNQTVPALPVGDSRAIVKVASDGQVLGYHQLNSGYLGSPVLELVNPGQDPAAWRLYVSVGFDGDLSLDGTVIASNPQSRNIFLAALTTTFDVEFARQYELPMNQYAGYLSHHGDNLYLIGDLGIDQADGTGSALLGDDFVFSLDLAGNLQQSIGIGDDNSVAIISSVEATGDGVFIGGYFSDTIEIAGESLTSTTDGAQDGFVAKLDPQLNPTFVRKYGGTRYDKVRGLAHRPDGMLVIAGSFEESATIPAVGGIHSAGDDDGYVAVIDISEGTGGGNSAPVSLADQYLLPNRTLQVPAAEGLLANDLDPDGDTVSIELLAPPSHGTIQISLDGSFSFTPNPGFVGNDSLTYRISDGELNSEPTTVSFEVFQEVVLFEDSFEVGTWNGKWVEDYQNDWFRSRQRATDGKYSAEVDGYANDATLTVSQPIDLSSVAVATLSFDWLIESGFDRGEYLRVDLFDGQAWAAAPGGFLYGNSDPENTWLTHDLELADKYFVEDFRFRFSAKVSSSSEDANVDNVRLVGLLQNDSNQPPVANNDSGLTSEDQAVLINVLANDSDPDGDAFSIASVTQPTFGAIVIVGGQVQYTPTANFNGSDSFTYTVTDTAGDLATASVDVTINSVNDAPVSVDDLVTTSEDTPVTFSVIENDSDVDGDTLSVRSISDGSNGTVTIHANNTLTYSPATGFFGSDQFSYSITDGYGGISTSNVQVTVVEQNDPPAANDDTAVTAEDVSLLLSVLSNDSDPDGDTLSIQSINQPANGVAAIVGGQIQYTPAANFNGSDSFAYTIVDTKGNASTATVDVAVTLVNDAPFATVDSYSQDQDTTLTIDAPGVLANDTDIDGDPLTAIVVAGPSSGALTLNADGSFAYTPDAGFVGSDSFTYQAIDAFGGSSGLVTVGLDVRMVARGPNLSHGNISSVTSGWQTVNLAKNYNSAVIVATPRYNTGSGPGVVRISNVTASSFDVRVDNAGATPFSGGVHFVAMEEGVYDVPGEYKVEAVRVDASTTSGKADGWKIGSQGYQQSYTSPVVVGQVMSTNDEDWSVFWSSSNRRTSPANSSSLNIGKHVGEDTDAARVRETLGYFVIESTNGGLIDGQAFTAGVGSDTIRGVGNGTFQYSAATPAGASTAVMSTAGMDGTDGGWAALMGSNPLSASGGTIALSIDEDQMRDSERNHTTEQVAYFVIGGPTGEGEASLHATPQITVYDPLDVNGDGYISPSDALQVINLLNSESTEEGDMARDTNGDGHVSPIDALLVINRLNANAAASVSNLSDAQAIDGYFGDLEDDEEETIFGFIQA
ncbi:Ig-like domain-containing protein [Aureliella helgolandensis]|uniref:Dockerin type I repeat protein n=1 Tax=Aureliella helgolandensis TaxID=2527968 RepID=A0A518GB63_9BACT|nr:tandem-95 repeat protein [Aureliella helgolandensis]QDV25787.1 Dockerin type I repeat protein [Aureliella helgolandensis]